MVSTYTSKGIDAEEWRKLDAALNTKTWIMFGMVTLMRIVYAATGFAHYFKAFANRKDNPKINQ